MNQLFKKQKTYSVIEDANYSKIKQTEPIIENSNIFKTIIYSLEKISNQKYHIKIKGDYISKDFYGFGNKIKTGYTGVIYNESSLPEFKTNYNIIFKILKNWYKDYFTNFYILVYKDIIFNNHFDNISETKILLNNNTFTLEPNNNFYKIYKEGNKINIDESKSIEIPNKIGNYFISLNTDTYNLNINKLEFLKNQIPVVIIKKFKENKELKTIKEDKRLSYNLYIDWSNFYKTSDMFNLKIPENIYVTGFSNDEENIGKKKILINWDKIDTVKFYKLKYRKMNESTNVNWKYIDNIKENKLILRNLENNSKYLISLAGIYSERDSSFFSQEIEVLIDHK